MSGFNDTNLIDLITEYLQAERPEACQSSVLITALLECWAGEKDYELKNQLLNSLVLKYASSIRNLVELNQLKSKFLGIAAHDLRSPLSSVRGFSEILLTEAVGPLTAEQREYITVIHDVSRNMLALVNDLLDISVIESGKLELHPEKVSLTSFLKERFRFYEVAAREQRITLHGDIENVPEQWFDPNKIGQVIDNLVSNAVKYSAPGTNIYLTLKREDGCLVVSVRDEGPGVPPEYQTRIFGEFQRLGPMPRGEKSFGLGLAIAKRIIDAHNGRICVKSGPGVGSIFSFTLPLGYEYDRPEKTSGDDRG